MEIVSNSLETTEKFAEEFLAKLAPPTAIVGATVVGLYGNLGSGKTTFVQSIAKILGIKEHITSPTFVIMKNYSTVRIS